MGTIPNSSLPFNDNAVNGDNVDYNAWNQAVQVIQLAVNDNQSQINAIKNTQTTILVAHGVAYPTSPAPSNGQLFYRDDLSQLKMFNGAQWEDVESVVATANGLSINGVTYNLTTGAVANTIALRDATGSLTAQTFNGNLSGSASELNGLPATDYLRTDAGAPNPQTVANPVTFNSGLKTNDISLINNVIASTGAFELGMNFGNASQNVHVYSPLVVDSSATFAGNVTAPNIGSASGTWAPASGSLNVTSGTVINIASVPGYANMFRVGWASGYSPSGYTPNIEGSSASNGNTTWSVFSNGSGVYSGAATTGSAGPSNSFVTVNDGGYQITGYFRIYGGYLQFVTTSSPSINTNFGQSYYWGVR